MGFVFKRVQEEMQLTVRQIYEIWSLRILFMKSDVNLNFRLNVGGNAINRRRFQMID